MRLGLWIRNRLWPESGALTAIPALDGLRAVAVLLVLVFHAWFYTPGYLQPGQNAYLYPINYGRTGVHLFFVLSGFLLFMPYARWIFGLQERPSAFLFYRRRLLRVGPAYWVCLGLLALAGAYTIFAVLDVALHVVFLPNLLPQTTFTINGVFWSMAIEVQFYILLPIFAWMTYRLSRLIGPWPSLLVGLGSLTAISLAQTVVARHNSLTGIPVISNFLLGQESSLPFWLDIFVAGMAVSAVYVHLTHRTPGRRVPCLLGWVTLIVGLSIAFGITFVPPAHQIPFKDYLFGVAYACILLGVLGGPRIARSILGSRPFRFIGLISYSCYLWHLSVLTVVESLVASLHLPITQAIALNFVIVLPCSIGAAYLSFQITERPFISIRKRSHERILDNVQTPEVAIPAVAHF